MVIGSERSLLQKAKAGRQLSTSLWAATRRCLSQATGEKFTASSLFDIEGH